MSEKQSYVWNDTGERGRLEIWGGEGTVRRPLEDLALTLNGTGRLWRVE